MWGVLLSAIIILSTIARAWRRQACPVIGPRIGGIRLHTLEELLKPLSSPPSVHKGLSKQTVGLAPLPIYQAARRRDTLTEVVLCIERARLDPGRRLKSALRSPKVLLPFVDEPQADVTER